MSDIYYLFASLFKNGEYVYEDKYDYKGQLIFPNSIGFETRHRCSIEGLSVYHKDDRNRLYTLSKKYDRISNAGLCNALKDYNHDYKCNLRDMTMESVSLRHRIRKRRIK